MMRVRQCMVVMFLLLGSIEAIAVEWHTINLTTTRPNDFIGRWDQNSVPYEITTDANNGNCVYKRLPFDNSGWKLVSKSIRVNVNSSENTFNIIQHGQSVKLCGNTFLNINGVVGNQQIEFNGGDGNDYFRGDAHPGYNHFYIFNVRGGAGDDRITLVEHPTERTFANLDGGSGNDYILLFKSSGNNPGGGVISWWRAEVVNGGSGNDLINSAVYIESNISAGTGDDYVVTFGGIGGDVDCGSGYDQVWGAPIGSELGCEVSH